MVDFERNSIVCIFGIQDMIDMVPDLDIPLLRTFIAVNDTGSITLAGHQVGRTQPAVTHQTQRLEKALGKRLFEGDRRTIALTRDGEMLLGHARTLLDSATTFAIAFQAPDIAGHVAATCRSPTGYHQRRAA